METATGRETGDIIISPRRLLLLAHPSDGIIEGSFSSWQDLSEERSMSNRPLHRWTAVVAVSSLAVASVWAADTRRAPPPKFDASIVSEIFFSDARKHLGPGGPPVPGQPGAIANPNAPGSPGMPAGPGDSHKDGNNWSALVSADTLESEIKAQPGAIDAALKAPNPQKSARMVMTYLAALYGVIYRYDKDVRWKNDSQPLRDSFARAGNNLKAWTDSQKKQVAKLKTDLSDLIQGNPPQMTAQLDGEAPWTEIADRPPLMHRLEMGQSERLNAWTKDASAVKSNKDSIIREGEIMAMLARLIQDKSYEFSDDAVYMGFAKELEKQAMAAVDAAKKDDAAAASSAVSKMQKSCDECHGGFR
jgi:hypothetical protein